jgi:phage shock protein PspC (stress-responsive transcriptional regulator)
MNKVIIINLNGNAYQLEEDAYDALRAYLDAARGRLEGNPDRDEIVADIEQAIADKFRSLLGVGKTVVLTAEVTRVIAEMGPVDDGSEAAAAAPGAAGAAPKAGPQAPKAEPGSHAGTPRRLYRVNEGAMLCGVCNGIGAFLHIDVSIVRVAFVILTLLYGFGGLVYLIMALILPTADTPEEKAAATGGPSTSADFIRRAREGYYGGMKTFRDKGEYREWKRKVKQDMRGWSRNFRDDMRRNASQWSHNWNVHWAHHPHPGFGWWFLAPIFGILSALLALLMAWAIVSVVMYGAFLGLAVPAGMPLWVAIVLIVLIFQMIRWPLRALRYALFFGYGPRPLHPIAHFWNAIVGVVVILSIVWLFTHHPGQVHEFLNNLPHQLHQAADSAKAWWDRQ